MCKNEPTVEVEPRFACMPRTLREMTKWSDLKITTLPDRVHSTAAAGIFASVADSIHTDLACGALICLNSCVCPN